MDSKDFWEQVHRVAKQAGRAYLATVDSRQAQSARGVPGLRGRAGLDCH